MTEIKRKWLLDTSTSDPVNALVSNPRPAEIVQIYLDNLQLAEHLIHYVVGSEPRIALRVPLEGKSPWIHEAGPWAGAVLLGADGVVRVRSQRGYDTLKPEHILVIKGSGSGERDETPNTPLSEEAATALAMLPSLGQPVQKWRYTWNPRDGGAHPYELDNFTKQLTGLVILEREFDTRDECDAFDLPAMFHLFSPREVTDSENYGDLSLAINGLPND